MPGSEANPTPDIRDLFPDLTDEELREAEINLTRYAELALRVHARELETRDDPTVEF